jgi:hypothetical protein
MLLALYFYDVSSADDRSAVMPRSYTARHMLISVVLTKFSYERAARKSS